MKILYINSSADWHTDLWVKYFARLHSVYLFSDKEDYRKKQSLFENITVVESYGYLGGILNSLKVKSHLLYQLNKIVSVRCYARQIDKFIQDCNIDIVHAHTLYFGYLASFIKSDIPVVFTPRGSSVIIHSQKNRIYKHMARQAFSRADIITGDSLLLQDRGYNVGARKERNYIIQNGVDTNIFFPKKNDLKSKYGVSENEILIFSPRAITGLYNIDMIIESLALLKKAGYGVKCMFSFAFGDEYTKKLKQLIKRLDVNDNAIWLGYLSYDDMAMHYNAADIVVSVPSSDSSPKSVYEAMFCQKPIVVTDLPWSHELLSNCGCLSRVKVRDPDELFRAIKKIIDRPEYANKIASNAFKYAHMYFDYDVNMAKMEKIMLQAVEN